MLCTGWCEFWGVAASTGTPNQVKNPDFASQSSIDFLGNEMRRHHHPNRMGWVFGKNPVQNSCGEVQLLVFHPSKLREVRPDNQPLRGSTCSLASCHELQGKLPSAVTVKINCD